MASFPERAPDEGRPFVARIFRNRFGHWRAGWRLALYLVLVFVIGKGFSSVLKLFLPDPTEAPFMSWRHSVIWVIACAALVLAALAMLRWIDRRPLALLGLGCERGWLREIALGLLAGVAATAVVVVIMVLGGWVSLDLAADPGASLAALPSLLAIFTFAAAVEELVFRGYPLQVLAEGSRRWLAGLVLCLVFTWGHVNNPDVTLVGVANIFLAAVVLTILYFETRRLWMPIAFHVSWNFSQSWLWGFDVSGIEIEGRLLSVQQAGPELLTGAGFGLEGSLVTTVLFAALTGWLLLRRPLGPAPEVAARWALYPAGFSMQPPAAQRAADMDGGTAQVGHEPGVAESSDRDAGEPDGLSDRSTG